MRKKVVLHCICGESIGMQWFLRKSIGIDHSRNYQWTSVFQERELHLHLMRLVRFSMMYSIMENFMESQELLFQKQLDLIEVL